MGRDALAAAAAAFADMADPDGRVAEQFNLVFLTGWAPDPSQPVPAKRGSATASLAEALKPKPRRAVDQPMIAPRSPARMRPIASNN